METAKSDLAGKAPRDLSPDELIDVLHFGPVASLTEAERFIARPSKTALRRLSEPAKLTLSAVAAHAWSIGADGPLVRITPAIGLVIQSPELTRRFGDECRRNPHLPHQLSDWFLSAYQSFDAFFARTIRSTPALRHALAAGGKLSEGPTGRHTVPIQGYGYLDGAEVRHFYLAGAAAGLMHSSAEYVLIPVQPGGPRSSAVMNVGGSFGLVPFFPRVDVR